MRNIFVLFLLVFFFSSCGLEEREKQLQQRETALNQKEQELLLKEKSLQLREEELSAAMKKTDTAANATANDSLAVVSNDLPGVWDATMKCTETTCAGSAVGDTKTEHWQISYQEKTVIVKAISGDKLVRVYTGKLNNNNILELTTQQTDNGQKITKMNVRLQLIKNNKMEGRREIRRGDECTIVYALELDKQ